MKKVLLVALLAVGLLNVSSAQENYKPKAGDFSLEVGFAPFGQNIINDAYLAGFIHFTNNLALRIGLGFGAGATSWDNGETGDKLMSESESYVKFSLEPGIVYSFKGTPRLTPYIGAGLGLGIVTHTERGEMGSMEGKAQHVGEYDGFTFGIGAATGFNYYFAKNLYLGAEVGLGLSFTSYFNEKITYSGSGAPSSPPESKDNRSDFGIGIGATPLLRLGWTF